MEVEHPNFKPMLIRDAFLEFFLTLMKNYKKYWVFIIINNCRKISFLRVLKILFRYNLHNLNF